jgi:hypothetical protein
VLLALSSPEGELIQGSAAVIQMDGWTWEDLVLRAPAGMCVNWPHLAPREPWYRPERLKELRTRHDERLPVVRQALLDALSYQRAKLAAETSGQPLDVDARWEAMLPVLQGDVPLLIRADEIQQIQEALALAAQFKLRAVLVGGYDAPQCTDLLKEQNVAVILAGVHRLPLRRDDPTTSRSGLPGSCAPRASSSASEPTIGPPRRGTFRITRAPPWPTGFRRRKPCGPSPCRRRKSWEWPTASARWSPARTPR